MTLDLERFRFFENSTIGKLAIDGEFYCYTLENVYRWDGVKVQGQNCIPFGKYRVTVTNSQRYERYLPLLIKVPGFNDVRIQRGMFARDSEGNILLGLHWKKDLVAISTPLEIDLTLRVQKVLDKEPIVINIRNVLPPESYTNTLLA
jgi:hypothetical protein